MRRYCARVMEKSSGGDFRGPRWVSMFRQQRVSRGEKRVICGFERNKLRLAMRVSNHWGESGGSVRRTAPPPGPMIKPDAHTGRLTTTSTLRGPSPAKDVRGGREVQKGQNGGNLIKRREPSHRTLRC